MIWVKDVKYFKDHKINISFNDGKSGIIDLADIIFKDSRNVFKDLRNIDQFKKMKLDMDTVVWSNGADLAPEFLYELVK